MLSKEQFAASTPTRFVPAAALLMALIAGLLVYGGMEAGLVISDLVEDKLLWRPRGSRVLEGRATRSSTKGVRPREERASPALCRWLRTLWGRAASKLVCLGRHTLGTSAGMRSYTVVGVRSCTSAGMRPCALAGIRSCTCWLRFHHFNDEAIPGLPRSGPMSFVINFKNVMYKYGLFITFNNKVISGPPRS